MTSYNVYPPIGIEPKYKLTKAVRRFAGFTLHRIIALRDFGPVKKGQLGGWVANPFCCCHHGNDWIGIDEIAFTRCRVIGGEFVLNNERIDEA